MLDRLAQRWHARRQAHRETDEDARKMKPRVVQSVCLVLWLGCIVVLWSQGNVGGVVALVILPVISYCVLALVLGKWIKRQKDSRGT